jgi:hypothetical protein
MPEYTNYLVNLSCACFQCMQLSFDSPMRCVLRTGFGLRLLGMDVRGRFMGEVG